MRGQRNDKGRVKSPRNKGRYRSFVNLKGEADFAEADLIGKSVIKKVFTFQTYGALQLCKQSLPLKKSNNVYE